MAKRAKKKWIGKALAGKGGKRRKGYLHRMLKVPKGERIPRKKLLRAAKKGGVLGSRARLALTLRKFHSKTKKKGKRG